MKASTYSFTSALAAASLLWAPSLCDITQGITPTLFARLDRGYHSSPLLQFPGLGVLRNIPGRITLGTP